MKVKVYYKYLILAIGIFIACSIFHITFAEFISEVFVFCYIFLPFPIFMTVHAYATFKGKQKVVLSNIIFCLYCLLFTVVFFFVCLILGELVGFAALIGFIAFAEVLIWGVIEILALLICRVLKARNNENSK